jgi:hypothetical protein
MHEIDIGHGHVIHYLRWAPDDLPANREQYGVPLPVVEQVGLGVRHPRPDGAGECESAIRFDLPEIRRWFNPKTMWQVVSWEPLTLSPSLLCRACGDHGFIRAGRWVPA